METKVKVLIGQRYQDSIDSIKNAIQNEKLNLDIQYVPQYFLNFIRKIEEWKPDVIITSQVFEDSSFENFGLDIALRENLKKFVGKKSADVYLFSNNRDTDVSDRKNCFTGIIGKGGFGEITMFLRNLPALMEAKAKYDALKWK